MKNMQQHKTVISCDKHIPGNWYALREWQSIACQLKKIFYILASFLLISQPAEIIRGVLNLTPFYCNSYLKIILSYLLHIHYMWLSTRILFTRIRNFGTWHLLVKMAFLWIIRAISNQGYQCENYSYSRYSDLKIIL